MSIYLFTNVYYYVFIENVSAPIPRPIPAYDNIWKKEAIFSVTPMAAGAASVGGERKIQAIIVLSFDHQVCFFNEYPWEAKRSAIFTQERSQEGEKHGFLYA